MSEKVPQNSQDTYAKVKDLKVVVKFVEDNSHEGILRTQQVKEIICQLILLGQKRGRPSTQEENIDEAA